MLIYLRSVDTRIHNILFNGDNIHPNFINMVGSVSSIYISGVRSLGHQVKPNMAAKGDPNLRQSQSPYAVFHVYVYSKNCAGGLKPT